MVRDYVICYDIRCPKRLGQIHRILKQQAMALQYSVFLFNGTLQQLENCLTQISGRMNPLQDDVRAYPLPRRGLRLCMGKPLLPEGIFWSGLPTPWKNNTQG